MIRTALTENGMVRGLPSSDMRITVYKGIPYAAPPVGENRWRAPQRCENWEGVRDCFEYGPIAVQDTPGLGTDVYCKEWHVDPDLPMSEDCLYLNVWTPAKTADEKLPVLVWIHGGAYQWGYASEMEFEGDRLARRGLIVVSMTYRLAALGFMAHSEITKENPEAPANFGCLDQQAALKWVKRNIAAFGGDPDRITIAGQSAGGASAVAQMTCEANYEDIKGAAIISGIIRTPYVEDVFFIPGPLSRAEALGAEFMKCLGVETLEEARKLDALYIRDRYAIFRESHIMMSVCIDEHFCKGDVLKRLADNECANVPIFVGNTSDEFITGIEAADEEELKVKAKELYGDYADEFLSFEENKTKSEVGYAPISGLEYATKATIESRQKKGSTMPAYYYKFEADIPGEDNPGTFHSVDLWFFFETLAKSFRPFVGRHYDLSRYMCNYLANFVKTGNPNGCDADGSSMPEWKPYSEADRQEMHFISEGPVMRTDADERTRFLIDLCLKEG